jgi:hypothetical protein
MVIQVSKSEDIINAHRFPSVYSWPKPGAIANGLRGMFNFKRGERVYRTTIQVGEGEKDKSELHQVKSFNR